MTLSLAGCWAHIPVAQATSIGFARFQSYESPNRRYRVEARSPEGEYSFEYDFTYDLTDAMTDKVLWTRRQQRSDPVTFTSGTYTFTDYRNEESPPIDILVDDSGWTVIRTAGEELVAVDLSGRDRWKIDFYKEALTGDERDCFVRRWIGSWSRYSRWYFVEANNAQMLVIRPWWGRRTIIALDSGRILTEMENLSLRLADEERRFVLRELKKGVTSREWETDECSPDGGEVLEAAYLAGKLQVTEAAPFLEILQDSSWSGSGRGGYYSGYKPKEGRVDLYGFDDMTMRQIVHLSLRRLGRSPRPYPCIRFHLHAKTGSRGQPYEVPTLPRPRFLSADLIREGMEPEDVLNLLGAPDYVKFVEWYYDMDASPPFTLMIKWKKNGTVDEIERHTPPYWMTDKWDEYLAYGSFKDRGEGI